jgi:hypothetical protein
MRPVHVAINSNLDVAITPWASGYIANMHIACRFPSHKHTRRRVIVQKIAQSISG